MKPGQTVAIACDGCAADLTATITFIAQQEEFTPPVIYSVGNREKLVFKAEARGARWPEAASRPARQRCTCRDNDGAALAIDVHGLTKRFGQKVAVDGIDIAVPEGEVWGFLGPNGIGKTTTIRMLCGLLRARRRRTAPALGYDIRTQSEAIKREVGYMTQRFSFWEDLSIRENLEFVARHLSSSPTAKQMVDGTLAIGLA